MPKNTLVFSSGGNNPYMGAPKNAQIIELRQQGANRFSVRYGLQLREKLDYVSAAKELGECIMHAQACEGFLIQEA